MPPPFEDTDLCWSQAQTSQHPLHPHQGHQGHSHALFGSTANKYKAKGQEGSKIPILQVTTRD